MSQLLIILDLLKNKFVQLVAVAAAFFFIGHCSRPQSPAAIIDTKIEKHSEEKIDKVTDTDIEIKKPDGTVIKMKQKITEDILKSELTKIDKHEVIQPEVARFFLGPAVATKFTLQDKEYEFGVMATYRLDSALITGAVYPWQQRAEASIQIPTGNLSLPGWLK